MRPRIGITTSTLDRGPEGPIQTSAAIHLAYAHCIYQAGGLPFLLPSLPEANDADEILAHLDGLLLSGGGDLDPAYWNEPPHPAIGVVDRVRDHTEIALVRASLSRRLPLLGICRGMQVMAVASGGALWQDLPDQLPDNVGHKQTVPRHTPCHAISVSPDSLLARIIDGEERVNRDKLLLHVNSFHHQAPRTCGTIFAAIAWAPDGVIEGLAIPGGHFALGVQWHPEEMAATDPGQTRVFSAFIAAARGTW